MDVLPKELSDELKRRFESPVFGPIFITWAIWNFDALFQFFYEMGFEFENTDSLLKNLHAGLAYTRPLILGGVVAIVREPIERIVHYFVLFLKSIVDWLGQRAEWPNLEKRIIIIGKEKDRLQDSLNKSEELLKIFSSILNNENLNKFSKSLSLMEKYDIAFVSEDVKLGDFLTYNSDTKRYEILKGRHAVNGVIVYKFSADLAIIGLDGRFPLDIFNFETNQRVNGPYYYDIERRILRKTSSPNFSDPVNATLSDAYLSIVINSKEIGFSYLKKKLNVPFVIQ